MLIQMINNIKQYLKNIRIIKYFLFTFIYPHMSYKKVEKNINEFFLNLDISVLNHNKKPKISKLIISLTSYPARLNYIEYAIFSLIQQSLRPNKIILWLSEEEFENNKKYNLELLDKYFIFGLEIIFIKNNYKSYNKLIHSLDKFPDYIIITVDDDIYYKSNFLKLLYNNHLKFPNDIISCKIRKITFKNKLISNYLKWRTKSIGKEIISYSNLLLGYSGVLYPPNCLYKDAKLSEIFLKLCPNADDIWFYIMALLNKTKIIKPKYYFKRSFPFDYELSNEWKNVPQLMHSNLNNNANNNQFKALLQYYDLFDNFNSILNKLNFG